jgi:hypothetical protein
LESLLLTKIKPKRYDHEKQDWRAFDMMPECKEQVVNCPKGYPGHKVYWLNVKNWRRDNTDTYYEVVIRINHAHFVANRDTGRHVDDEVGRMWVNEKYTVVSRRLDYAKMPEWLKQ